LILAREKFTELDNAVPTDLITRYDDYQYINEEKFNLSKLGRTGQVMLYQALKK
jgi:hypothetical protein